MYLCWESTGSQGWVHAYFCGSALDDLVGAMITRRFDGEWPGAACAEIRDETDIMIRTRPRDLMGIDTAPGGLGAGVSPGGRGVVDLNLLIPTLAYYVGRSMWVRGGGTRGERVVG